MDREFKHIIGYNQYTEKVGISNFQLELRNFIALGETELVVRKLLEVIPNGHPLHKQILIVSNQISILNRDKIGGMLHDKHHEIQLTKIILDIIDKLPAYFPNGIVLKKDEPVYKTQTQTPKRSVDSPIGCIVIVVILSLIGLLYYFNSVDEVEKTVPEEIQKIPVPEEKIEQINIEKQKPLPPYYIVLESFQDKNNAEDFVNENYELKLDIIKVNLDGTPIYRVGKIGFISRKEAMNDAKRIRKIKKTNVFVQNWRDNCVSLIHDPNNKVYICINE